MALPIMFGVSWEEFIATWCLGNAPTETQPTVEDALSALVRLWPEKVAAIAGMNTRGLIVVSPAILHGLVLSACEGLEGFEKVLRRLKTGERSAYAELTFAARLVRAGFCPSLEPPLGNCVLDTLIPIEEGMVYCEVIAPETSDAIVEVKNAAFDLARILREENTGKRVEVLLSVDIDDTISAKVAAAVRLHPASPEVWPLDSIALISTRVAGDDPNVGPTIPSPEAAAIVGAAQGSVQDGVRTAGIVRVPVTDVRAKRLLYGESHHFSREEKNILVMDVSKIVSSPNAWGKLIEKCLQPTRNRRFGAVVFYFAGKTGHKMTAYQEWRVIRNPYAYQPIPDSVLDKIRNPESSGS